MQLILLHKESSIVTKKFLRRISRMDRTHIFHSIELFQCVCHAFQNEISAIEFVESDNNT